MADEIKPAPHGAGEIMIAYKQVAMTQEGRAMLSHLVQRFGYSRQSTFSTDPLELAFREGQRTVMVHIGRMIDGDPAEFNDSYQARGDL